jgi:hypothetical protein
LLNTTACGAIRHAHLAPDQRCEALAKLNVRPLFAINVRLSWNHESAKPHVPAEWVDA